MAEFGPVLGEKSGRVFQAPTLGERASVENVKRQIESDKAKALATEKDSSEKNLTGIMSILTNANKLPKSFRKMSLPVLEKRMRAEGLGFDPEMFQSLLGDDDALKQVALKIQEINSLPQDDPQRNELMGQLTGFLDNSVNREKGLDFLEKFVGAGENPLEGRRDTAELALKIDQKFNAKKGVQNAKLVDTNFRAMLGIHRNIRKSGRGLDSSNKIDSGNIQAFITLFNKLTDPNSVVRESEFARTAGYGTIVQRVKNLIGGISEAEFLRPEQVDALMKAATILNAAHQEGLQRIAGKSRQLADFAGVPSELLELETGSASEALGMDTDQFINELQKNIDTALSRNESGQPTRNRGAKKSLTKNSAGRKKAVEFIERHQKRTGKKFSPAERKKVFDRFQSRGN